VGKMDMTGLNNLARRSAFPKSGSRVVYKTLKQAMEIANKIERGEEGRKWNNTFFFVDNDIARKNPSDYQELKSSGFVWNLNIPDTSMCTVTPMGFLIFSMKFNDFLERIEKGLTGNELDMKALATILLLNIGEEPTDFNIDKVVNRVFIPLSESADPTFIMKEFSGKFTWNLPDIRPQDWTEIEKHLDSIKKVYEAL
jgi:hypothetical protein